MTVWDYFILGLGYGACALGIIMLLSVAFMTILSLAATIIHYAEKEDADE